MVYVIMSPDVLRDHVQRRWEFRCAAFTLASGAVAGLAGLALGLAGQFLPGTTRLGITTLLGGALAALGVLEGRGRGPAPLQRSCETPRRLLDSGPLLGAARNGVRLGHGGSTRIGFWLWYSIPLGAFLLGNPLLGAVLYGTYGVTRGAAPWLLVTATKRLSRRGVDFGDVALWLLQNHRRARSITGFYATLLGVAAVLVAQL